MTVAAGFGTTADGRWTILAVMSSERPAASKVRAVLREGLDHVCPQDSAEPSLSRVRVAAVGASLEEAWQSLEERLAHDLAPVPTVARGPVFMFSGQGSQSTGMGRGLLGHPYFKRQMQHWCSALSASDEKSLFELIYDDHASESELVETWNAQRALFALEVTLASVWMEAGVQSSAVIGHSIGELSAAYAARVMSTDCATRLVRTRASLMNRLPTGAMIAVRASASEAIARTGESVTLAAVNGPKNTVLSGCIESVERAQMKLESAGIACQRLNVAHAFHSAALDELRDEFMSSLHSLQFDAPRLPLASNVTGELLRQAPAPGYWFEQARSPVRYADGVRTLVDCGAWLFLEVGPGAVLRRLGTRSTHPGCTWLSTLEPNVDAWLSLLVTAAALFEVGCTLRWPVMLGTDRHD